MGVVPEAGRAFFDEQYALLYGVGRARNTAAYLKRLHNVRQQGRQDNHIQRERSKDKYV